MMNMARALMLWTAITLAGISFRPDGPIWLCSIAGLLIGLYVSLGQRR